MQKNDLEEHFLIFLKHVSNDQNIYMLNASNKKWINENDIVEQLPFPDMTYGGNQCRFNSQV